MAGTLRFPLYIFRSVGSGNVVFEVGDGEKLLPLFTSAETASLYRECEPVELKMVRLTTPQELRELLLVQREDSGEFKIAMDPMSRHSPCQDMTS